MVSIECRILERVNLKEILHQFKQMRRMDREGSNLLELDMAGRQYFVTFMAKATQFEELGNQGSQFLAGFQKELEMFRRPPLHEMSKVLASIIENNQSERLRTYVQAGCRHSYADAYITIKSLIGHVTIKTKSINSIAIATNLIVDILTKPLTVHNIIQGLKKNIDQAKELLEDMENIVGNVTALMQKLTNLLPECMNISTEDSSSEGAWGANNEEGSLLHNKVHRLEISDYMSMMSVIYGMLRKDYTMQEKIVSALQLNTPSEVLESYNLMWTLRPFVDERVIHEALNWT